MRLDRILALRGGYSRKQSMKMIRSKRVYIDDVMCNKASCHFDIDANIRIDEFPLKPRILMYVYHKPVGMLSTTDDELGRPCVGDILPVRHHLVGRLDMDTSGLLLLSMEGSFTQFLLHPKRAIEREYIATVEGEPKETLVEKLAKGVETSLGLAQAKVVSIEANKVRLIVTEGRNRIVRRMLHNSGHSVIELQRLRFGNIELGDLEEGHMRPVSAQELESLKTSMQS